MISPMRSTDFRERCRAIPRFWMGVTLLLLIPLAVSSCARAAASTSAPPPPTATTLPAATPTLPTLSADDGWKAVLTLGYVAPGVTTSGGAFQPSNPFAVVMVCEGVGTVDIEYPPLGSSSYTCTHAQQRNRNQISLGTNSPANATIHVTVEAGSGVVWRAIIEERS